MADLSSLLNPAPTSEETAQEAHLASEHLSLSGVKPPHLPPVETGAPNVQPSIKSPLDTLADAATSSGPLLSPTNPNGTSFMNLSTYRQSSGHASSRPTSSRITPPLSYDQSHATAPTSPAFSPGLQQYHHPTSSEVRARRASETAETSIAPLPPLRGLLPDSSHSEVADQFGPPIHPEEPALPILPGIDTAAALIHGPPGTGHAEDAPVTSQIGRRSPQPPLPTQDSDPLPTPSEQVEVKTEITDSATDLKSTFVQPSVPALESSSAPEPNPEIEASTSTADMKPKASPVPSNASAKNSMLKPQPASSRKRPAPKKGTATAVKPAAKKRKIDKPIEAVEKSSPLPRYGTPNSSRASKTPAPKNRKQESATPQRSSSIANDDDDDDEDGVFCICRGPDNHTWMIACDGPCEDWFHGRCINMTEKEGELIEKYYCPNCTEAGQGETLWKPMCRLESCRQPARVSGHPRSKYCSDEHGHEFMRRLALQEEAKGHELIPGVTPLPEVARKGRRTNNSFANMELSNETETPILAPDSSQQSAAKECSEADGNKPQPPARGGILRPGELKALVTNVKDITEFRKLGNGVLSPPPTAAKEKTNSDIKMEDAQPAEPITMNNQIPYNPTETEQLRTLTTKKDELRTRKKLLDDRDIFLTLVRERAKGVLDELKKKENVKDICGFDSRLVWVDEEFDVWRTSPDGVKELNDRKLGPPTSIVASQAGPQSPIQVNGEVQSSHDPNIAPTAINGDVPPVSSTTEPAEGEELGKGICKKKKCERHRNWFKIQQQEIAFAKDEVRQGMRKLDEEEKGVRDRARIRWLEGEDE
ncbi:MAG: hypothetical protein LQ346_001471 [Caloplaca aetnensis]|nr:MAG: hypothetical protein LQ346_001471 [Caloplaca aetnensis]